MPQTQWDDFVGRLTMEDFEELHAVVEEMRIAYRDLNNVTTNARKVRTRSLMLELLDLALLRAMQDHIEREAITKPDRGEQAPGR